MEYILNEKDSRANFIAYAPMHKFAGWVKEGLQGSVDVDLDNLQLLNIEAVARTSKFDTGDTERNKAMDDYFSLPDHPETSFVMTECKSFKKKSSGVYSLTVLGILTFAGIRRQLPINCIMKKVDDKVILDLAFKWSFKAYGMKVPRLLFLTVKDIVDIDAHLEFTQE